MPKVVLASALSRWLDSAAGGATGEVVLQVESASVAGALERAFAQHPALRSYVLDEQGGIRRHVAIFVDGTALPHHGSLEIPLAQNGEVFVMQALSGG